MSRCNIWLAAGVMQVVGLLAAGSSARADIRVVAAPVEPVEQAFVEALRADLRARGMTVVEDDSPGPVPPQGPPQGTLEVEFERAERSTAVWLQWRGGSEGWTARLDALADAEADAKVALERLDTPAFLRPPSAARVVGRVNARRPPKRDLRTSLTYNPLWVAADWHQLDLELRWGGHAALVEGLIFSGEPTSVDDVSWRETWPGALERSSGWGLQLAYRYYGNPLAGWFLYTGPRLLSVEADFVPGGMATALNVTFYLGIGGRWASAWGPTFGIRGGLPAYQLGDDLDLLTGGPSLLASLDLELSLGWAF